MHSPLWSQARRNAEASGLAAAVRTDPSLDTDGVPETPPLDFTPMFEHIEPLVSSVDLAICHMETPIAPPGERYSTHPRYGVPAEVIDALAASGFDHCSTASNHTFDRGMPAFDATIARFAQVGITQEGMAATPEEAAASLLDVDGTVIGHLSYSYGWDAGSRPADEPWRAALIDPDRIIADATAARDAGAEFVVASLHWGNSGSPVASTSQREIANRLAESGVVDLVVGHHAHVVQPVERIGDMWVAYGLGNLISNLPVPDSFWGPETQDGALLTVEIDRTGSTPTITAVEVFPTWVDKSAGWIIRDVLRSISDGEATSSIDTSLRRTSRVLGDWITPPTN
ncbi:MAG: CapA family protein [Ilumatobacteraceae bacterium]